MNSRLRRAAQLAFRLIGGISPGCANSHFQEGSLTICAKITARAVARGRRAHHRCRVLEWPCRIDFSHAAATLMASSGNATSISFYGAFTDSIFVPGSLLPRRAMAIIRLRTVVCAWGPDRGWLERHQNPRVALVREGRSRR